MQYKPYISVHHHNFNFVNTATTTRNLAESDRCAIEGENCVTKLDRVAYTIWRVSKWWTAVSLKTTIVINKWTVYWTSKPCNSHMRNCRSHRSLESSIS